MEHVLSEVAKWIESVIGAAGYAGIVLLMALESACIPLPSEVIMPFSGALTLVAFAMSVHQAPLNLAMVALAGAVGCAVGSAAAYAVGYRGGREFVFRYGKYILLKRSDVEKSEAWFLRRGAAAVFIARLLPVVRTFISLPAGISRMPFGPFIALSFIGSLPWCYALAYIGTVFANHLDDLKRYFHGADAVIIIILAIPFSLYVWHHVRPENKRDEAAAES